jgi:hypothetical protein
MDDELTAVRPTPVVRFTRQQYEALREAQRVLHDVLPDLDKMDGCGWDCQGYRILVADLANQLQAIERNFMTPPPG